MQAYEIRGSFGYENLVRAERPDPLPGPGEALVRVRAVSLNYRDHLVIQGAYNPRQPLPLVPCSDGAGEVVSVGPGVSRVKVGDRVMPVFAQNWIAGRATTERLRSTLGGPRDGLLRELAVFPAESLVHVPEHLDFEQAATLPCAALTAWNALTKFEPLTAGQRVLLLGTGGVSVFGLQLAKAMGAETFITSSSDEKLARARALGADHCINYKTTPEFSKEVRRLTQNQGVDIVLEVGGAGTLAQSVRSTAAGGLIALLGTLSGGQDTPNLTAVFMNHIRVQGLVVGNRDDLEALTRAVRARALVPVIDRTFDFADAHTAFQHLALGQHFGKVVIRV